MAYADTSIYAKKLATLRKEFSEIQTNLRKTLTKTNKKSTTL